MIDISDNVLTVIGSKETVDSFIDKVKTDDELLSFSKHFPLPEKNKDVCSDWRMMGNWGTESDAFEVRISREVEICVEYFFKTEDIPPAEWFLTITKELTNATFILEYKYNVGGYIYEGRIVVVEGVRDEGASFDTDHSISLYFSLSDKYENPCETAIN